MEPRREEPDHHVALAHVLPGVDLVERDEPHDEAAYVEGLPGDGAPEHGADLGELASRERDPCLQAALIEAFPDLVEEARLGVLDREVVQQGDGLGSETDEVVHVHRDEVDPDRVVAVRELRHEELRPDAVRRHGEPEVRSDLDHVREVADVEDRCAGLALAPELERAPRPAEESRERLLLARHVDAGLSVAQVVAHAPAPGGGILSLPSRGPRHVRCK